MLISNSNLSIRTEIESFRRKINTFLIFLNQVSVYWWNKLFPFKDKLVLRPSKTGDQVRKLALTLADDLKRIAPELTNDNCLKNVELKVSLKEIEALKQHLFESVIKWIDCDGRDVHLKRRRYRIMAQNYNSVRIENFSRIKVLLKLFTNAAIKDVLDANYNDLGYVTSGDIDNEGEEIGIQISSSIGDQENEEEVGSPSVLITGDY